MATIGSRVAIVASLLGGRTDLNSQISQWLANGYRDLASTIPFETLEFTFDTTCSPNVDVYDYPTDARAIQALTLGIPASAPRSWISLKKKNMAILDRYATTPTGQPSVWAPHNNQFYLRQVPNGAFPIIIRYWQKIMISAVIDDTPILVPDDWIEIIDYEAQMRGYMDLQENDKAASIRNLLYGNPRQPGRPGLIKQRLTRIQAEYGNANYGMRPRIRRFTFVK